MGAPCCCRDHAFNSSMSVPWSTCATHRPQVAINRLSRSLFAMSTAACWQKPQPGLKKNTSLSVAGSLIACSCSTPVAGSNRHTGASDTGCGAATAPSGAAWPANKSALGAVAFKRRAVSKSHSRIASLYRLRQSRGRNWWAWRSPSNRQSALAASDAVGSLMTHASACIRACAAATSAGDVTAGQGACAKAARGAMRNVAAARNALIIKSLKGHGACQRLAHADADSAQWKGQVLRRGNSHHRHGLARPPAFNAPLLSGMNRANGPLYDRPQFALLPHLRCA